MTTPNTPENPTTGDKCPRCNSPRFSDNLFHCGYDLNRKQFRTPLCHAIEAKNLAEAAATSFMEQHQAAMSLLEQKEAELTELRLSTAAWTNGFKDMNERLDRKEAELARLNGAIYQRKCASCDSRTSEVTFTGENAIKDLETQNEKLRGLLERALDALDSDWIDVADIIRKELDTIT